LYNEDLSLGGKTMNTQKDTKPGIENTMPETAPTRQQQPIPPSQPQAEQPQAEQPQAEQPRAEQPRAGQPKADDWRMNREWCLNQALDIVKSLEFEVKDLPDFLEKMYRKIIELADDARK
jgi:hypothetical protein